jgi:hypothetical protein
MTTMSNYALRLQASVMKELRQLVKEEGATINQFINVAVAEKIAALRTADYFRQRAARADMDAFWAVLEQAGTEPPRAGDELPTDGDAENNDRAPSGARPDDKNP